MVPCRSVEAKSCVRYDVSCQLPSDLHRRLAGLYLLRRKRMSTVVKLHPRVLAHIHKGLRAFQIHDLISSTQDMQNRRHDRLLEKLLMQLITATETRDCNSELERSLILGQLETRHPVWVLESAS